MEGAAIEFTRHTGAGRTQLRRFLEPPATLGADLSHDAAGQHGHNCDAWPVLGDSADGRNGAASMVDRHLPWPDRDASWHGGSAAALRTQTARTDSRGMAGPGQRSVHDRRMVRQPGQQRSKVAWAAA